VFTSHPTPIRALVHRNTGHPSRCSFPLHLGQDFYRGLCSESRIIRASGKVEWVPDKSVRNEPLDLAVLCRAAAAVCGIDRFSEDDWAELEGITPAAAPKAPRNDGYWGARGDFWGPRGGGGNWFK
jgi:phage terminase large subunit GpA-like protein